MFHFTGRVEDGFFVVEVFGCTARIAGKTGEDADGPFASVSAHEEMLSDTARLTLSAEPEEDGITSTQLQVMTEDRGFSVYFGPDGAMNGSSGSLPEDVVLRALN